MLSNPKIGGGWLGGRAKEGSTYTLHKSTKYGTAYKTLQISITITNIYAKSLGGGGTQRRFKAPGREGGRTQRGFKAGRAAVLPHDARLAAK